MNKVKSVLLAILCLSLAFAGAFLVTGAEEVTETHNTAALSINTTAFDELIQVIIDLLPIIITLAVVMAFVAMAFKFLPKRF